MADLRPVTCCFSGYRIEKCRSGTRTVPLRASCSPHSMLRSQRPPLTAVRGFSPVCPPALICGPPKLFCARAPHSRCSCCVVPFDGQADRFPLEWKRRFNRCLLAADKVYALAELSRRVLCRAQPVYGGCIVKAHLLL